MKKLQMMGRRVTAALLAMVCSLGVMCGSAVPVEARSASGKTVIVIDAGHGGTEMGAAYKPYGEKSLTLYVAMLIQSELQQYDNVEVYMTRTSDVDVSIGARVDYARSVNADFLYSVHFNASGGAVKPHGSMVLISAFGSLYAQEASFALLNLQQLEAAGLKNRGLYTRLGKSGQDYYGIIRRSAAYGIPAVITEHCYLDSDTDRKWLETEGSYAKLAHADATALAEYLHLKSTALGVDYTNFPRPQVAAPADNTTPVKITPIDSSEYWGL